MPSISQPTFATFTGYLSIPKLIRQQVINTPNPIDAMAHAAVSQMNWNIFREPVDFAKSWRLTILAATV